MLARAQDVEEGVVTVPASGAAISPSTVAHDLATRGTSGASSARCSACRRRTSAFAEAPGSCSRWTIMASTAVGTLGKGRRFAW